MADMYGPLRYFTSEMVKNLGDRAKEVMTFMYPPVTVFEEGGELVIEADLPGFDKKDVKVRLEKESLSISASRKIEKKGVVFMDQRPEEVSKRIKLPMEVDQEAAFSAKYQNGVLTVKIPVKGSRSIKVE